MPSLEHNGLVELFRENPPLAPHLLDVLFHVDVPEYASVGVAESALDQLVPIEFRADLVVELRDPGGDVLLSIIVEVQRDVELAKTFSWPVYLAVERSRKRCPVILLVIATDSEVAAWAAASIDLGLGLSNVRPLVLGSSVVPEITDRAVAEREVELAVLSALTHGNGPNGFAVVQTAVDALTRLDPEHAAVYFQIIYSALREPLQRALEKLIMERQAEQKEPLPPFLQQFVDRGKLEGKLEGERKGKLEGMLEGNVEGKLEGRRAALQRVMHRAGLDLTDAERARIEECRSIEALDRWLDNVLGAKSAADVLR